MRMGAKSSSRATHSFDESTPSERLQGTGSLTTHHGKANQTRLRACHYPLFGIARIPWVLIGACSLRVPQEFRAPYSFNVRSSLLRLHRGTSGETDLLYGIAGGRSAEFQQETMPWPSAYLVSSAVEWMPSLVMMLVRWN